MSVHAHSKPFPANVCRRSRKQNKRNMSFEKYFWNLLACFVLVHCQDDKVVYKFQEFPYKGNSKNEIAFREFETACEQNPECQEQGGVDKFACIRKCISPSCYHDLYSHDPLEEGEIDVRLNSFKGCFVQRLNRPRQ